MYLETAIARLEKSLSDYQKLDAQVSEKSVGWHIDHTLRVIIGVCMVSSQSNPDDYRWKFNKTRFLIFMMNKIPRGKGRAPKQVVNNNTITLEGLLELIEKAKKTTKALDGLSAKANFNHPYFGMLNLKQTKKFLRIHTEHHLKIIDEVSA